MPSLTTQQLSSAGLQLALHLSPKVSDSAILAVHGYLDHGLSFLPALAPLASQHQLALLDRRGYGDSQSLPIGRYDLASNILDIHQASLSLRPQRIIIVGHSIGAVLALAWLAAFPDSASALVLLDPFPLPSSPDDLPQRLRSWTLSQLQAQGAEKTYASADEALARLREKHPRVPEPALKTWGLAGIRPTDDGARWRFKADHRHRDQEPFILLDAAVRVLARKIKAPTLVLRGQDSLVKDFPPWLDAIKGLQRESIPDAGHMLQLEKPAECGAAIARFIEALPIDEGPQKSDS